MASQASGILRWTSSIRDSMINDPGRQFFEDQVQSQGFLFLEEYLDNIWAAAKQDSFVDLVKTPGRRRASPRKAQPAINTHTTDMAFSDDENIFQSDHLKPSLPLFAAVTKLDDNPTVSPSQVLQVPSSPPEIVEDKEVATQPLSESSAPSSTFIDLSVPLKEEDASANVIARSSSLSQFPSLAAPSPLRKSVRNHREPSLEPSLVATPGNGLIGNHTSWLAKVREAKAMELTNKRASVAPTSLAAPSGGVKRKSGELPGSLLHHGGDGEERKAKILKTDPDISEVLHPESRPLAPSTFQSSTADVRTARSADDVSRLQTVSETDMMAPLKKAIEVLRARTGKSLAGNSLEINIKEPSPVGEEEVMPKVVADETTQPGPLPVPISSHGAAATEPVIVRMPTLPESTQQVAKALIAPPPSEESKRLSISDLIPKYTGNNTTSRTSANESSVSTTPPDSPPPATKKAAFFVPGGPVFNKPPPVFIPPPTTKPGPSSVGGGDNVPKGYASQLPGYSLGAPFGLGLQPTKLSPPRNPLSGQSTQSSLFSDRVFDSQDNAPAWAPRSQEMTSQESRDVVEENGQQADPDDDDSWRIDDKFAATNQMWTPFAGVTAVEDSMTWSTAPSESQIGNKSPRQDPIEQDEVVAPVEARQSPNIVEELDQDMHVDDDMKGNMLDEGKPTVSLVTANNDATKDQLSASHSNGEASQPVGFFGHATKLVSTMLGVNKKNKIEPPKSIQLAAAAAKKQQEEQDRKAARLKEMEARRQAVIQKKAEEEKVKADEEEKKAKEDTERRKKGREENTGKRPLLRADSKLAEEDNARKRKVTAEVSKTKPPSKEKKDIPPTRIVRPGTKAVTITKQSSATSLNQTSYAKAAPLDKSITKATLGPASAKGKGKMPADPETKKPAQSQMALRAHPQRLDAEPPVEKEIIELPEPNSEYSDSEDESRQQKQNAPEWTQSPELRAALESQSRVNPDDIFGPVRPLRMEDIFRTRTSRFRARTSSANWSGPDGLKQEEEREYARRMGFR